MGLALPFVFLQIMVILWQPELDGQRRELVFENSNMTYKLLESLHDRINLVLVGILYNALYKVSDVCLFMLFQTCNDVVTRQLTS